MLTMFREGIRRIEAVSGVTTGSNHNATESLLVVAVGDLVRSAAFNAFLVTNDYRFKQGVGKWKGVEERSFILRASEYEANHEAFAPWFRGQETVLYLGPAFRDGKLYGNRRAWLLEVSPDGAIWHFPATYLGLYGWVGNKQPASGDWTYNPEAGFFAIEPAAVETVVVVAAYTQRIVDGAIAPGADPMEGFGPELDGLDTSADSPWPLDGNSPTAGESRSVRVARGSDRYA